MAGSGVIKEYRCSNCTRIFDNNVPVCIHCGSTSVTRIYVTPFGFKSDKTKFADNSLEHLTSSYNLADYSNNESTRHTPGTGNRWHSVANKTGAEEGTVDLTDLQIAKNGSVPVKELPVLKNKQIGLEISKGNLPDIVRDQE